MNITIMNTTFDAATLTEALEGFHVISGRWDVDGRTDDTSVFDVADGIRAALGATEAVEVEVYHANGTAIDGDLPSDGHFVAQRR